MAARRGEVFACAATPYSVTNRAAVIMAGCQTETRGLPRCCAGRLAVKYPNPVVQ
jgi:hypothetical protein